MVINVKKKSYQLGQQEPSDSYHVGNTCDIGKQNENRSGDVSYLTFYDDMSSMGSVMLIWELHILR